MREIETKQAVREALQEEMRRDARVYFAGELVYRGGDAKISALGKEFGPDRVVDTPLSETVIAGHAVGAALAGLRPVVEISFADFAAVCFDEIVHKMGKWRYMHGAEGGMQLPIVVRMGCGGYVGAAAEHSETPLAFFLHAPGLKVVFPSTPYDAKGLFKSAVRDNNPVLFFEHKLINHVKGPVPEEEYTIPLGVADIKKAGKDVTVVAIGFMVPMALKVAGEMAQAGVDLEVIDPRTLEPLDIDTIVKSVTKTGRLVVVDEDMERCGMAGEIGMQVMERAYSKLKAPPKRVCAANVPIPASEPLEKEVLPQPEDIVQAVRTVMAA